MTMKLKTCVLGIAALAAFVSVTDRAEAIQVYSFETITGPGPDGFFGLGAAVSQDVIGATDGSFSMKYLAGGAGFVGARTEAVIPAALNNPPGVSHVLFDMFIPAGYAGTFADIGITVFGHDIDNGIFGVQSQFADTVSITALGAGQHVDLRIDLDSDFFTNLSFNEIYGDEVTDLDVASAFQFYISKSVGVPLTVYIDNVRLVDDARLVPEPATALMLSLGAGLMGLVRRRR